MTLLQEAIRNIWAGYVYTPEPEPYDFDVPPEEEAVYFGALDYLGARVIKAGEVMTEGNMKIDKRVLIFNLPPIKSCPNCQSCRDTCYAVPAYRQYPYVWEMYDANFKLAQNDRRSLVWYIERQLEQKKKSRRGLVAVRVHSSGDFFSQDYVDMWAEIARRHPDVKFYAYTKADKALDMAPLDELPNFNVIRSMVAGKWRNYGAPKYIEKVKTANPDAVICPAIGHPDIHCGNQCNYCIEGSKPLFYIHGQMKAAGPLKEHDYTWEGVEQERQERAARTAEANRRKRKKTKALDKPAEEA